MNEEQLAALEKRWKRGPGTPPVFDLEMIEHAYVDIPDLLLVVRSQILRIDRLESRVVHFHEAIKDARNILIAASDVHPD